jgi:penicillin-binding protein 2
MVRPHLVAYDQLPAEFRQAVLDSFPGSGDTVVPLNNDTWMTVTEGMAAATTPGLYHTAEGAHIEGVDFAGKTGTAQVVGGGDTHTKGGAKTPNSWFVGMVPRRNPEIAIVVLQEHGDWGSLSAKVAQAIVITYVNKKRLQNHNLLQQAGTNKPIEVGAVWSAPGTPDPNHKGATGDDDLHAGHFLIDPAETAKALASKQSNLPAWLAAPPLRWRERLP